MYATLLHRIACSQRHRKVYLAIWAADSFICSWNEHSLPETIAMQIVQIQYWLTHKPFIPQQKRNRSERGEKERESDRGRVRKEQCAELNEWRSCTMPDRTVLDYHNTLLRESDVKLLTGPHWLNDQLISFYLEYLEHHTFQNARGLLFISPEVVQCLKFVSREEMSSLLEPLNATGKSFIFLPLNDNNEVRAGGHHWSLLVFSRPDATFFYYDSLSSLGTSLRPLRPFLVDLSNAIDCPEIDVRQGDCAKQNNSYDCGIHVLCNIECLARRALKYNSLDDNSNATTEEDPNKLTNQKIRQKRQEILNLIQKLGGHL